jgi:hypothetical protein
MVFDSRTYIWIRNTIPPEDVRAQTNKRMGAKLENRVSLMR